jgi:bis(5'-nucleosyl)-tetraphosphatase (symmetrical)
MASYAIGDIQGCFDELQHLLQCFHFDANQDRIYLLGDLVNRGPQSLQVLRWAKAHSHCVGTVLGNHDLHLLAVSQGVAKIKGRDTFAELLAADDAGELLHWLRHQDLLKQVGDNVLVHAGLLPNWSISLAQKLANEVTTVLRGDDYVSLLSHLYGNEPRRWSKSLTGWDRLRLVVNAMTRLRLLDADGGIDMAFKGELSDAPVHLTPWFKAYAASGEPGKRVIFGHWSALGLMLEDHAVCLDTGCVWGRRLTAMRLEDGAVYSVPSRQPLSLNADG